MSPSGSKRDQAGELYLGRAPTCPIRAPRLEVLKPSLSCRTQLKDKPFQKAFPDPQTRQASCSLSFWIPEPHRPRPHPCS